MLGLRYKQGKKNDLAPALTRYITSNYTPEEAKSVEPVIVDLGEKRNKCVDIFQRFDTNQEELAFVESYYHLFRSIAARCPFGVASSGFFGDLGFGKVNSVKVSFEYKESFRATRKLIDNSKDFELACVLFNLGALYSREACRFKREGDLKTACQMFTKTAGVFQVFSNDPALCAFGKSTPDLTKTFTDLMVSLMLAQAQGCFYEKAASVNASTALLAKLAGGTATLYEAAAQKCVGISRSMQDAFDQSYNWVQHIKFQTSCYSASSLWQMARAAQAAGDNGPELAYLSLALSHLKAAQKYERGLLDVAAKNRAELENNVSQRYKVAKHENDTIYFSRVPVTSDLPPIDNKVMVKIAEMPPAPQLPSGFDELVPASVRQDAARFKETVDNFVGQVRRGVQEKNEQSKANLNAMGLPASLDAIKSEKGIPNELWSKIQEIQLKGGVPALYELKQRVFTACETATKLSQDTQDMLQQEQQDDLAMRTKWGARWNRRPSEQITPDFHKRAQEFNHFLGAAKASDGKIDIELNTNRDMLASLARSRQDIEQLLPQPSTQTSSSESAAGGQLSALLQELEACESKRTSTTEALTEMAKDTSAVTMKLLESSAPGSAKTVDQVFEEEMKKYHDLAAQNQPNDEKAMSIMDQIVSANETFKASQVRDDVTTKRQNIVQSYHMSINLFNKLLDNLNEGYNFYTTLTKTKAEPLHQGVTDFVLARDMEKKVILGQLPGAAADVATGAYATSNPNAHAAPSSSMYTFNPNQPNVPVPVASVPPTMGAPLAQPIPQAGGYSYNASAPPPASNPVASNPAPPAAVQPSADGLAILASMGFNDAQSREALIACNNDVSRAAMRLSA